jgi:diacylglycerol kinase (ATP)
MNFHSAGPSDAQKKPIGKTEKDKLNKQERTSRMIQRSEKEAFQCRANSLRRAIRTVLKHTDDIRKFEAIKRSPARSYKINIPSSTENSPCPSPLPVPEINLMSPSFSTPRLSCISPFPDIRRESVDENFLNTLSIPVPRQFADESRRNSGVPEK